jgi:vesicle-fusing ATPase
MASIKRIVPIPDSSLVTLNKFLVSPSYYQELQRAYGDLFLLKINGYFFMLYPNESVDDNSIAIPTTTVELLNLEIYEPICCSDIQTFSIKEDKIEYISMKLLEINNPQRLQVCLNLEDLAAHIRKEFRKRGLCKGQVLYVNKADVVYELKILTLVAEPEFKKYGVITRSTEIYIEPIDTQNNRSLLSRVSNTATTNIDITHLDPLEIGIGGMSHQIEMIHRRVFATRGLESEMVENLGINHTKGILLYGPPGTGKTTIAKQLVKYLGAHEPKIVNGPEILDKYVGQSEENIRNLFKEAEEEQKSRGSSSQLHIIIFDEFDAIAKPRGTIDNGTGVNDTVVNQLLSKLDGVEQLNNILVIALTNRKDMIDEALLRPGRIELHIEIGLPDERGRYEILQLHTAKLRDHNKLGSVNLEVIASRAKNFSGAELAKLVKCAQDTAITRCKQDGQDPSEFVLKNQDFEQAFIDTEPAFGINEEKFKNILHNCSFKGLEDTMSIINECKMLASSPRQRVTSVLLTGEKGSGKTTSAAYIAMHSGVPYAKIISPDNLVTYSDVGRVNYITKIFEDAYSSSMSLIILNKIERLIEYVDQGNHFSNMILQALLVLIDKRPKKPENKVLIIGTTSREDVLKRLGFSFEYVFEIPTLKEKQQIAKVLINHGIRNARLNRVSQGLTIEVLMRAIEDFKNIGEPEGGFEASLKRVYRS